MKKEEKEEICENKIVDKKQILQDKLKKIFLEREQNKYKYNKINIPDNLKYSSDNENSINSIDNKNEQIENKEINNKNDNEEKNNNIVINPTKNYVIKKPPERRKNRNGKRFS